VIKQGLERAIQVRYVGHVPSWDARDLRIHGNEDRALAKGAQKTCAGSLLCDLDAGKARLVDTGGSAKVQNAELRKQSKQLQKLGDLRDGEFIPVE
jgi:hypothetical protein